MFNVLTETAQIHGQYLIPVYLGTSVPFASDYDIDLRLLALTFMAVKVAVLLWDLFYNRKPKE